MGKSNFQISYGVSFLMYINFLIFALLNAKNEGLDAKIVSILTLLLAGFVIQTIVLFKRKYKDDRITGWDYAAHGFNFIFAIGLLYSGFHDENDTDNIIKIYSITYLILMLWSFLNVLGINYELILNKIKN